MATSFYSNRITAYSWPKILMLRPLCTWNHGTYLHRHMKSRSTSFAIDIPECRMDVKDLEVDTWQKINGLPRQRGLSMFIPTMKLLNMSASGSSISSMRSNRATNSTSWGKYKFPKSCILRRACYWNAKSSRTISTECMFAFGFVFLQQVVFFTEYDHLRISNTSNKGFSYQLILEWICPCWLHILPVACIQDPSQILAELPLD